MSCADLRSRGFALMFALAAFLSTPRLACAHALRVDCHLRGEEVLIEAYFDDDTPAGKAKVRVFDDSGTLVADGRTDAAGRWSVARPKPGRYRVEVDAGGGHFTKQTMDVPAEIASGETAPIRISEGPSRQESAKMFWPKLIVGLGAIAGFGIALWIAARRKKAPHGSELPGANDATA
jgi:hypothetical protein